MSRISFYIGQLQADYAIAKSDGKAHVLIFGDKNFHAKGLASRRHARKSFATEVSTAR